MSASILRPHRLAAAVAGILFVASTPLFAQASYTGYSEKVVETILDNGLRLLILERHNAPVVSVHTYVDVGSVDENVGMTGVAHMMEHMAFKGTDLIGTTDFSKESEILDQIDEVYSELEAERDLGADADAARVAELERKFKELQEAADEFIVDDEWSKAITSFGGVGLNASTSWDSTNYFVSLPSRFLDAWLVLESERFQFPVFREFYKERDVVKEERRTRTEDRAIGKLIELHLAACFTAHPYHQPTIGYMSDLDHLDRPTGEAFFKRFYHPGNLIVTIVGDVVAADVIAKVKHYFGDIAAGPARQRLTTIEPDQQGERRVEYESPEQPIIIIGYHKPSESHPDAAAYNALSEVLAGGRTSRLYRTLVDEKRIALAAGAFGGLPGQKYPNLFSFFAVPMRAEDGTFMLDECEAAIYEEIVKIQRDLVSAEELARVKTNARAEFIGSLDSNAGLARGLATYEAINGDWRDLFTEVDRINAVTLEDLQRVARAALNRNNRTVSRIVPPNAPEWEKDASAEKDADGDKTKTTEPKVEAPPPALLPEDEPQQVVPPVKNAPAPAPVPAPAPEPAPEDSPAPGDEQIEERAGMHAEPGFGVELPAASVVNEVNRMIDRLNDPNERVAARKEIIAFGKGAVPVLMMRKDDPSFTVRWEFVNILGYMVDERARPAIVENVLGDENPHVRWRGMWALAEYANRPGMVDFFKDRMKDPDEVVAWNSAIAVTMLGSPESLSAIHAGLKQKDSWRRWEAINALSRVWNEESSAQLEPFLSASDDRERQETMMALGKIGDEKAGELLIRALADSKPGVRWRAAMGLERVRDQRARAVLLEMKSTETDEEVLRYIDRALKKLPVPREAAPAPSDQQPAPEGDEENSEEKAAEKNAK